MKTWHYIISESQRETAPETALASLVSGGILRAETLVWSDGMASWQPARQALPELFSVATTGGPPPLPGGAISGRRSHEIDFQIHGDDLQLVEIELDPGESAVAEAGALVWKDASVAMATVFGDGSGGQGDGFMGKLLGAGKRLVTGESLFTTVFTHNGTG